MVQLYVSKGLPQEEAETVINIMAEHTEFFVDVMMVCLTSGFVATAAHGLSTMPFG